ncbi:GNAT family N-acetyltransferase [Geodermatophilus sp. URMC 63]
MDPSSPGGGAPRHPAGSAAWDRADHRWASPTSNGWPPAAGGRRRRSRWAGGCCAPVDLDPEPDDGWLAASGHLGRTDAATARAVLTNAPEVVFASVRTDPPPAPPVAVARGVVTDDWLGVTAVTVAEEHRRRGLATAVVAAVSRWGAQRGAGWVYLQVSSANAPARAVYRRAGFVEHHRYHYRWAPA